MKRNKGGSYACIVIIMSIKYGLLVPVAVAAQPEARTVFACSDTEVCLNPTQGMDVFVCLFCVVFCLFSTASVV
jgi:hypothetical protein